MAKFRKKPVVIEAIQFDGTNSTEILNWVDHLKRHNSTRVLLGSNKCLTIVTLEGTMEASPGDWIICGVKGELYPCKPDIFTATYESAD